MSKWTIDGDFFSLDLVYCNLLVSRRANTTIWLMDCPEIRVYRSLAAVTAEDARVEAENFIRTKLQRMLKELP